MIKIVTVINTGLWFILYFYFMFISFFILLKRKNNNGLDMDEILAPMTLG